MMDLTIFASIFAATLRLAAPVVITAEGEVITEKAGIINIGIEGIMLLGAFAATYTTYFTRNAWLGVLSSVLIGIAAGILHALISINPKGNQTLSGIGINGFAYGATAFGLIAVWGELAAGNSPNVPKIPQIELPFSGPFNEISVFVVAMFLVAIIEYLVLRKTSIGLRLRAVGENPGAADAAGINVHRTQLISVVVGSALAALAGAYLAVDQQGMFIRYMSSLQGFTALAVVAFGNWNPLLILGGGLIFGFGNSLVMRLAPAVGVGIPPQLLSMIPSILTLVIYAVRKKVSQPAALGKPYEKE